jgi:hypothetical protein
MMFIVISVALGLAIATGLVIRYGKLPPWGHRDLLAYAAMMATILGLLILVIFVDHGQQTFVTQADRLINELVRDPKVKDSVGTVLTTIIDAQAFNLKLGMIGIITGILSLGLVISARTLKASGLGANIELATGDDGKLALPVVVTQKPSDPVPVVPQPPLSPPPQPTAPPSPPWPS